MDIFKKFHKIGELSYTMPEIQAVPYDQDTAKCLDAIKKTHGEEVHAGPVHPAASADGTVDLLV